MRNVPDPVCVVVMFPTGSSSDQLKWTLNVSSMLVFVLLDEEDEEEVVDDELDAEDEAVELRLLDPGPDVELVLFSSQAIVLVVVIEPDVILVSVTQGGVGHVIAGLGTPNPPYRRTYVPAAAATRIMLTIATAATAIPFLSTMDRLFAPASGRTKK